VVQNERGARTSSSAIDLPVDRPATTGKGHGTSALCPSDVSDSGSDLEGAGDDSGAPGGVITPTGRSIGDANVDSDIDPHGTGEVMTAGRDLEVGRLGREAPALPTRSADELPSSKREARPGEAGARQGDPDAASTPLQRLQENDDLN
jgi:hypothetical protein